MLFRSTRPSSRLRVPNQVQIPRQTSKWVSTHEIVCSRSLFFLSRCPDDSWDSRRSRFWHWQVCKCMRNLIGSSSLLQYHLELGRSGMEDGPMSTMRIAERREKLQAHTNAWRNLQWTDCIHLLESDQKFAIHVASGGILAIRWRKKPK